MNFVRSAVGIQPWLPKVGANDDTIRKFVWQVVMNNNIRLLEKYIDSDAYRIDNKKNDPMRIAIIYNKPEVIDLLISKGRIPKLNDAEHLLNLQFSSDKAEHAEHINVMRKLIAGGFNVQETDEKDNNILDLLIKNGMWHIVEFLLNAGVQPNKPLCNLFNTVHPIPVNILRLIIDQTPDKETLYEKLLYKGCVWYYDRWTPIFINTFTKLIELYEHRVFRQPNFDLINNFIDAMNDERVSVTLLDYAMRARKSTVVDFLTNIKGIQMNKQLVLTPDNLYTPLNVSRLESRHIPATGRATENGEYLNEISYEPILQNEILVNFPLNPGASTPHYAYNFGKYFKKNTINSFHRQTGTERHPLIQSKPIGKMTYYKANLRPPVAPNTDLVPAVPTVAPNTGLVAPVPNVAPAAPKRRTRGRWCPGGRCPFFGRAAGNENNKLEGGYKRKRRNTRRNRNRRSKKN